ncbi:MAG: hypothetical protein NT068_01375 [Candidatus Nomurabacteria bacterium]|nr:hypothetical protein [Candidatus Nomurabacteria bacterium]
MLNNSEIEFSKKLIKGKIAEVIFEQMIRDEKKYTVIPFGYEHTMPMLAQYQQLVEVKHIIKNISEAPDFALISEDKSKLFLVEVKYQKELNLNDLKGYAEKLLKRWDCPWLFVATPKGFYCGMSDWIIKEDMMNELSENWVTKERQNEYLKLLNEFEK